MKSDIKEIKEGQKEMMTAFSDLRVLVAGGYVPRKEFDDHKKADSTTHLWFAGTCVTIGLFVLGLTINALL